MDVIRPTFTVTDLAQLPDDGKRYEILGGDLAVGPSRNRKHQRVVQATYRWLFALEQIHYGQAYVAPFDVVFDTHNVAEPDLLFVQALCAAVLVGAPRSKRSLSIT